MNEERQWFDFVLVKQSMGDFLYRAPAFSKLKIGDSVLLDTVFGEEYGTVQSVVTLCDTDEKTIDFIMKATRSRNNVRKVLAKVNLDYFEYMGEQNDR